MRVTADTSKGTKTFEGVRSLYFADGNLSLKFDSYESINLSKVKDINVREEYGE